MNKKRWLVAIMIIAVLTIAFLWGGDYQKSPMKVADKNSEAQSVGVDKSVSTQVAEAPKDEDDEDHQDKADADVKNKVTDNDLVTEENTVNTDSKDIKASTKAEESSKTDMTDTASEVKATTTGKPTDKPTSVTDTSKSTETAKKTDVDKQSPITDKKPIEVTNKTPDKGNATKEVPKKDKYLTDAVPTGKPKPVEWQDATINKKDELTITLSVSAKTILDNMDKFNKDKLDVLPADGVIYKARKVTFYEGESVFDVLLREMKKSKIHMEFSMTPIYNSNYIEGINNIYEFDCGELSGWMYKVNGWFPNYGASRYVLKSGDIVDWVYTCDLGRDVGGDMAAMGGK